MTTHFRFACLTLLLATSWVQARPSATIQSPAPLDLLEGQVVVTVEVVLEGEGSWTLQALREGEASLTLASGSGALAPGTMVYSGALPTGAVQLQLMVENAAGFATHSVEVVSMAPPVPGWPFRQGELGYNGLLHPMAECRKGEVLLARQADGSREAVEMGELVWLDAQGTVLPGWPLQMIQYSQALSPRSEPLPIRRQGDDRLAVVSKTHVLEFNRQGQLTAQSACGGIPLGEAVLLERGATGDALALFVLDDGTPTLKFINAQAGTRESFTLPGLPSLSRPVLGDFSADGQVDILALVESSGSTHAWMINGRSLQGELLASLPGAHWSSAAAGDVNGDFAQDLVLSGSAGLFVLDASQQLWNRSLPGESFGPAALMDLDGDHQQEVAVLSQDELGSIRLRLWDAQGDELPFSGALLGNSGSALHAPQLVMDQGGLPHLLAAIDAGGSAWASRILDVDLQGQVADRGWYLPTAFSGTPRLVDLHGDGSLSLLAGDVRGRWVAWPTGWHDACPPHPRGDERHGGLYLQPVPVGAVPDVLSGTMAFAETHALIDDQLVEDLRLERGHLDVNTAFHPQGTLTIKADGRLCFGTDAELVATGSLPLVLQGQLDIVGRGAGAAFMPGPSSSTPCNELISRLELDLQPGSQLSLRHCLLHALPRPLVATACSLSLDSCWFLAGAGSITAQHAVVQANDCLFQPGDQGLLVRDGSRLDLRGCVLTSSTGTALELEDSFARLQDTQIVTCAQGLQVTGASVTVLDSVHFQANGVDLVLGSDYGVLDLHECDFVESTIAGLVNHSAESVVALACHWDADQPTLGPVIRREDRLLPVKPAVIPNPVFNVEPGPMVDGDEPLEWVPVEFSVGGIPIQVEYRVYRSEQAYDLVRPEHLVAVTSQTRWRDPEHHAKCFYAVTASMGKQVVD